VATRTRTPARVGPKPRLVHAGRTADLAAAFAGLVAGAAGIAVAELIAGIITGAPSLIIAVGDFVISHQPPGAKDVVVSLFGSNDKLALNLLVLVVALVLAAGIGILARHRWNLAVGALAILGVVLALAALAEPLTSFFFGVLTPLIAFGVTMYVLRGLIGMIPAPPQAAIDDDEDVAPAVPAVKPGRGASPGKPVAEMPDWDRRRFLITSAAIGVGSVAIGAVGRTLLNAQPNVPTSAAPVALPVTAGATLPPLPANASLNVPGITPIVMPNKDFYRIDTALVVPRVDVTTWKLTVKGLVNNEVTFTYDQLKAMGLFDQYVTIQCVSNYVGGNLVGNAKWTGVHLRDVLAKAGVRPEATQIVGRSVDDFTVGFPTEWAMDPQRDPMVVIGMNDAVLPAEHGYPARLIVPGLYGYVSATKWLSSIELTTWDAFDAYWVPLGWSKTGPILTQSRIDVPQQGATVKAGKVTLAGVAWAPDRGISKVEVRVDLGNWMPAILSAPISKATWVQWEVPWNATPGGYRLEVRATDGTGVVQTDQVTDPAPDGARGHHMIDVTVA
jgi:DMSO/TMAO reductase YedYZ molybdopterin-dependent catalytic subunit